MVSNETKKTTIQITKTEKPQSYEFGKAGARHKVYYETVAELIAHVNELKEAGFIEEPVDMSQFK